VVKQKLEFIKLCNNLVEEVRHKNKE